jgi:4-hydroxybenzoate polyprenyltransferase
MGFAVILGADRPDALVLYAGSIAWVIGLRHHLRPSGRRGRRADRHQVDRAPVRRGDASALVVFYGLAVILIGTALVLGGARGRHGSG